MLEYRAIFQCFDFNGDKYLDINELSVLLQQLGTPKNKQSIRLLVEQVHEKEREERDRERIRMEREGTVFAVQTVKNAQLKDDDQESNEEDSDSTLQHQHELNEMQFIKFMTALGALDQDPEKSLDMDILTAFRYFDNNDEGTVNLNDVKNVMLSLGEPITDEQMQQFIDEADADGDGTLSFEEWKDAIKSIGLGGSELMDS
eukprot:CAMPEP_0117448836 /NCGR_PEP_ID=MMETSP0759-20121206/7618_1 /TAXON_ID=63605 /ORGANISM="Percolomonas cosmopolitus, Strain WS" /LENGTH=201 /DNA_ID=CAMNT_0005241259 /DNA_START=222 /DNA_END=827 /DNA_ORIENTATION=-